MISEKRKRVTDYIGFVTSKVCTTVYRMVKNCKTKLKARFCGKKKKEEASILYPTFGPRNTTLDLVIFFPATPPLPLDVSFFPPSLSVCVSLSSFYKILQPEDTLCLTNHLERNQSE